MTRPKVVVVGSGFGGLAVARSLRSAPVDVLVVDRANHHLFQPLLYQVATAGLAPTDIAYPVRGVLRRIPNATFRLGTVSGVDWARRTLRTVSGEEYPFDHLVLAAGAQTADFGVPGVTSHATGLKSVDDALQVRARILSAFERADAAPGLVDAGALNVVIVGGGPTGVELAGAVSELYSKVLARDFPRFDLRQARIALVEVVDAVLPTFHPRLQEHAAEQLRRRGVELRLSTSVTEVTAQAVVLSDGATIPVGTVVWAAGVQPVSLGAALGLDVEPGGRIRVDPDLSVPVHTGWSAPRVWAIGDVAASPGRDGLPLPQVAPVAIQGGRHVARQIERQLRGEPTTAFRYRDKGSMATIGRRAAVAELPAGVRLRGTLGWLAWLWLHLLMLIGFRNRVSVLVDWAWNYVTWDRAGRLLLVEHRVDR
jgi:NADH:ubiquinone reductase (H+-translocating)